MRIRQLAAVALAAAVLTACGGSDDNGEGAKKGPRVASDAASALEKADAVHITGGGTSNGVTSTVDLRLQGPDATGSITQGGQKLQLVSVGGKVYVEAPSAFWAQSGVPQATAGALDGKWVIVPDSAAASVLPVTLKGLADELRKPTSGATINDAVHTGTLNGKKVVVVTQSDGSTLDVAATGSPYPLRTVDKGTNPGTVTASDFGKKTTITAPSGALDLSQVAGG
jgi:hypothetical protein